MNIPEDCHLAYIVSHEAWYWDASRAPGENPHLSVSASGKGSGGGVAWEFDIEEMELGGKPVTRVKVFDDAYAAFAQVPELFAALADGGGTTLAAVRDLLDMLGAVDETERVSPYAEKPAGSRDGHAETVREALRLAQDTAPNAAAALRFAEALAATEGQP
jgi:hypothetical protein